MNAPRQALARLDAAEDGLLAIGIPRCPASALLAASLPTLDAARPDLVVESLTFRTPEDWALRETDLWPRGIRVSRSSVPALFLLSSGRAVATRPGAAPAFQLDAWLESHLGPAATPLEQEITTAERKVLADTSARRVQHATVKGERRIDS